MNPKTLFLQTIVFLASFTFFGSAFAQNPCRSEDSVQVTMIRSGAVLCVQQQTAETFVADGRAFLTQNLTVDPEVPIVVEEAIALEDCQTGHVEVMLINGVKSFCVTQDVAKRWLEQWLAVEVDDQEGLEVINAPQIFPARLCKEDQIQVLLTNSEKIVCASKVMAQKWLLSGFATEANSNTLRTSKPCKSSRHIQATIVRGGSRVCALESTVSSWERQGIAMRTSAITVTPQTELVAEDTIPLEECEQKHVRVRLVGGTPAFCINKNIAERWVTERLAVEVDEDEGLTVISAPQLFPEHLCKEDQVKISVAEDERIICTLKVIAQKWLDEGFATKMLE